MTPRAPDPAVHDAVLSVAVGLLAEGGRAALTTRRLATEAGVSTMAIYTRFGNLVGVHQAVREHGFRRLNDELDAVGETDDPVADLNRLGLAGLSYALANRQLYQAMFADRPAEQPDAGSGVFDRLEAAVWRCVDAGRFGASEEPWPSGWAAEFWIAIHGVITLALADVQPADRLRVLLSDLIYRLAVGHGDRRSAARGSVGVDR